MPIEQRYLVMFSGGAGSWAAARRLVDRHGPENVAGLFADTLTEDPDLYRFLDDSAANLGIKLTRIADGRDVWQVFIDERFIGSSMVDPCSKILKRRLMDRWRDEHCDPASTTLVYGLDWSERTRIEGSDGKGGLRRLMHSKGWCCEFPMDERPYLTKGEMLDWMRSEGVDPPALYALGFPHNNCGGFCVKAGLGQFRHLLRVMPERYAYHERREQEALDAIGPTARPFLRIRTGKKDVRITMKEFRERCEDTPLFAEDHGWGCGGGCAIDEAPAEIIPLTPN